MYSCKHKRLPSSEPCDLCQAERIGEARAFDRLLGLYQQAQQVREAQEGGSAPDTFIFPARSESAKPGEFIAPISVPITLQQARAELDELRERVSALERELCARGKVEKVVDGRPVIVFEDKPPRVSQRGVDFLSGRTTEDVRLVVLNARGDKRKSVYLLENAQLMFVDWSNERDGAPPTGIVQLHVDGQVHVSLEGMDPDEL